MPPGNVTAEMRGAPASLYEHMPDMDYSCQWDSCGDGYIHQQLMEISGQYRDPEEQMQDQREWLDVAAAAKDIFRELPRSSLAKNMLKQPSRTLGYLQTASTWWAKCVDAAALERDSLLHGGMASPQMCIIKLAVEAFFVYCREKTKWITHAEPFLFFNIDTPRAFSGTLRLIMVYLNKDMFKQCKLCWLPINYRGVNREDS
jgi:hypothetical protein